MMTALVERELDSDIKMTEKVFDKVLEDSPRRRWPPLQKYQKVSTLMDRAEGDDNLCAFMTHPDTLG